MVYAVLLAFCCLAIFGAYLTIRSLIRLYKDGQKRMFRWVLGFFLVLPTALFITLSLWQGQWTIWVALPIVLIGLTWMCEGYFVESFLRQEKQMALEGRKRVVPTPPPGARRKQFILLGVAIIIWCYGMFIGIANPTVETCALCLSIFLLGRALATLWRYRGF